VSAEPRDAAPAAALRIERELLAAIASHDEHARLVYADWLEERGDAARAEYVRLQAAIVRAPMDTLAQHLAYLNASKRLRELAGALSLDWRIQVARPAVEGCRAPGRCTQDWGQLVPTDHPRTRSCPACGHAVRYCETELEALALSERGLRVVVDFAPFDG
jgi:uncharacterized protein (TIGR02996 family)